MYKRVRKLDEQQMTDIAPWYASQPIIRKLPDVEIEALSRYYAALGGRPAETGL